MVVFFKKILKDVYPSSKEGIFRFHMCNFGDPVFFPTDHQGSTTIPSIPGEPFQVIQLGEDSSSVGGAWLGSVVGGHE